MNITEVEIIPMRIPVKSWRTSHGTMKNAGLIHVRIFTDQGIVGYGETMDVTPYSGLTLEGLYFVLRNYLVPAVIGEDPFNVERIFEKMNQAIPGNEYAKTAVDYALFDVMGKATGCPVYKLMGGQYRKRIQVVGSVHITPPEEAAQTAKMQADNYGVKTIKVKIGDPKSVERVKAVRDAVGPNVKVRVDANAAYSVAKAIQTIKEMEPYNLEIVEQPVGSIKEMAEVRRNVDVPVMSDESIHKIRDVFDIMRMEAADIVYLKPVKFGGLHNARKLAAILEVAEIPCVVGGMGGISFARVAVQHLATACPAFHNDYAQDLMPVLIGVYGEINVLKKSLFETTFKDGCIIASSKPGLGVEPDEKAIEKLRIKL